MNIFHFLRQTAMRWPNRPAVFEDETLLATYEQLHARAVAIGRRFSGACGLRPGDRIAIFAPNCAAFVDLMWASWAAELTVVPINAKLHPNEVAHILKDSRAQLCFAAHDRVNEVQNAASRVGAIAAVMDIREIMMSEAKYGD
jgi:long-chain acyl-CoA synthetase